MKKCIFFILLMASQASYSNDLRLSFGIGRSDVELPEIEENPDNSAGQGSYYLSTHFGYILKNNITIDAGFNSINDLSFFGAFDSVDYTATELLLGYLITKDKLYLEPKIGYARWSTTVNQGALLNPGPELTVNEKGHDAFFALTAGYRFNKGFGMSLSYKHLESDGIDAKSYFLGFDLAF